MSNTRKRLVRLSLSSTSETVEISQQGVNRVNLINYSIYNVAYTVNSSNNVIVFTDNSTTYTATLTQGFYTATNLASEAQTALSKASGDTSLTVTYSSSTGLFTFASNNQLQFNFNNYPGFASLFGFNATQSPAATSLTSNFIPILGIPYYYLYIREFPNNDANPYPCFAVIHNNVPWGMLLTRGNTTIPHSTTKLQRWTLGTITIELRDHNYRLVDLHGVPWLLELELEIQD